MRQETNVHRVSTLWISPTLYHHVSQSDIVRLLAVQPTERNIAMVITSDEQMQNWYYTKEGQ